MTLSVSRKASRFRLLSLSQTHRAPPSLQPHYRTFFATTECSVPVPRFGTQILVALPLAYPFQNDIWISNRDGNIFLYVTRTIWKGIRSRCHFGMGISLPSHRGDRFPRSTKEPRPHSRRLYAGRHLGSNQVPPRFFPGFSIHPGFDVFLEFRHVISGSRSFDSTVLT